MEIPSYEELMEAVLARVSDDVDKREGSLIYTAVAPVCAELAQAYIRLAGALDLLFFDTSEGEALDRLAAQFGLSRREASCAVCLGVFKDSGGNEFVPPVGMRLGYGGMFYRVSGAVSGGCALICETAGTGGNQVSGELLPVDYLEGFGSAELSGLLTAGRDAESDEELRQRLTGRVQAPAFGGNLADYREKVLGIQGVGAVKVTAAANGAGTVKLTLLDDAYSAAGTELVSKVQAAADPGVSGGGKGFAPIGHKVTAAGAAMKTVNVAATVTVQSGADKAALQARLKAAVEGYFLELRKQWESAGKTVVRLSGVVMKLLEEDGVLDVSGVTLNGGAANLETAELEVPVLGTLTLTVE